MSPKGRKKFINIMYNSNFEIIHHAIAHIETEQDGQQLDKIVDALAAQALGRSELLLEEFGLSETSIPESKAIRDSSRVDQ